MLQFLAGFTLGNVVGMYLAQNYEVPNIAKKIEAFKKDVEAKKKPPEWAKRNNVAGGNGLPLQKKIFILLDYFGVMCTHLIKLLMLNMYENINSAWNSVC